MEDEKSSWNKGKHLSEIHRKNISKRLKGRIISEETRKKLKERIVSEETKTKIGIGNAISMKGRFGEQCNSWKGGSTKLDKLIRESLNYGQWVSSCMTRDNWTCQTCNRRGIELQIHHIKPLSIIIKEDKIKTIQEAMNCKELWNIKNGITLCINCHKQTDTYCGKIFKKLKETDSYLAKAKIHSEKGGKG